MGTKFMDKQLREIFLSRRARFSQATNPSELIANADWHVLIETNSLMGVPSLMGDDQSPSFREWFLALRIHLKSTKAYSAEEIATKIPRMGSRAQGVRLYPVRAGGDTLRLSYTSRESKNLIKDRKALKKFLNRKLYSRESFELVYGDEIAGRLVRFHRFFDGGFTAMTPKGYRNFRYDRIVGATPARGMGKSIPRNHQINVALNRNFFRVFLDGFPQD